MTSVYRQLVARCVLVVRRMDAAPPAREPIAYLVRNLRIIANQRHSAAVRRIGAVHKLSDGAPNHSDPVIEQQAMRSPG
jgi:hypothetical protein